MSNQMFIDEERIHSQVEAGRRKPKEEIRAIVAKAREVAYDLVRRAK